MLIIIIDIDINQGEDGKLCGDVDYADVIDKVKYIKSVPGGIGLNNCKYIIE